METPEENYWIDKIRNGETDYFSKLYEKYYKYVFSICYRFCQNKPDAEEQLQEVFLRLLAKFHLFRGDALFKTWLTKLTVNHLINFNARVKANLDNTLDISEFEDSIADMKNPITQIELSLSLEKAIRMLPVGFKEVFILHDQVGLQHKEIGEVLAITSITSRSRLSRARLVLRNILVSSTLEGE